MMWHYNRKQAGPRLQRGRLAKVRAGAEASALRGLQGLQEAW